MGIVRPLIWRAVAVLAMWSGVVWGGPESARAHFLLNLNVRVIHVEHLENGLRVYVRLPMPYLVADRLGAEAPDGLPEPAPYTNNAMEDGKLVHYLDADALRADPKGLGRLVAEGHPVTIESGPLAVEVEQVRAYPGTHQPSFASIEDARASFEGDVYPDAFPVTYVGDTVVDVILRYASGGPVYDYALSSTLDPGLPGQDQTANLLLDHYAGETQVFRARGLLDQPIMVSRSAWAAAATFVTEGARHILEGWDHVLFVICLVLGAASLVSLLWRATGFTIGHSVTLMAGFFGYVPSGAWFIPAVEMGIALSIIYAALIALTSRGGAARSELTMFAITVAIGLLHGLGFSFVLHEILRVDSPNIWQSLLAFNVGVEVGQVVIILVTWPLFCLIAGRSERVWRVSRWAIATPCVAVAAFWTGQRASVVLQAL